MEQHAKVIFAHYPTTGHILLKGKLSWNAAPTTNVVQKSHVLVMIPVQITGRVYYVLNVQMVLLQICLKILVFKAHIVSSGGSGPRPL